MVQRSVFSTRLTPRTVLLNSERHQNEAVSTHSLHMNLVEEIGNSANWMRTKSDCLPFHVNSFLSWNSMASNDVKSELVCLTISWRLLIHIFIS